MNVVLCFLSFILCVCVLDSYLKFSGALAVLFLSFPFRIFLKIFFTHFTFKHFVGTCQSKPVLNHPCMAFSSDSRCVSIGVWLSVCIILM